MKDRIAEYKETLTSPLRKATLCFLIKDDQILLAMKKRGFAAGKWNGVGGKMDDRDRTIRDTAIRETGEEIGIIPTSLKLVATLNFYHLKNQNFGQQVSAYLCDKWDGEPAESEEMAPKLFNLEGIPYKQMWEDDILWIPKILDGKVLEGDLSFDENEKMIETDLREVTSL